MAGVIQSGELIFLGIRLHFFLCAEILKSNIKTLSSKAQDNDSSIANLPWLWARISRSNLFPGILLGRDLLVCLPTWRGYCKW